MNNKFNFINLMYRKFQALFWGGIIFLSLLTLANHIDIISPLLNIEEDVEYTVRGNINLIPTDWDEHLFKGHIILKDSITQVHPTLLNYNSAFVRLDYSDISAGLTFKNTLITLLAIGGRWIWIILIFQLMKLLKSVKENNIFTRRNIKRIQLIGLVFLISPLLVRIKDLLFTQVVASSITLEGFTISYPGTSFWILPRLFSTDVVFGLVVMLCIFILTRVFFAGLYLKTENDLTV